LLLELRQLVRRRAQHDELILKKNFFR
jgi:hypothetical protein